MPSTLTSLGFSIDGGYYCKINNGRYIDGLRHNLAGIMCGESKINESHPRQSDGSRTGGMKKNGQLPFPIMSFDVNLPAINHSEVAPDKNRLTRLFLTNYCKALSDAFNENINVHKMKIIAFESTGRLKQYITRFLSKKTGHHFFRKNTLL